MVIISSHVFGPMKKIVTRKKSGKIGCNGSFILDKVLAVLELLYLTQSSLDAALRADRLLKISIFYEVAPWFPNDCSSRPMTAMSLV